MSRQTFSQAIFGLALGLSVLALAGCSGATAPAGPTGDDGTSDGAPAASGHQAGECFFGSFEYVDCSEAHDSEIVSTFAGFDLNSTEGLGGADAKCGADTNAFLGVDALPQDYRYGVFDDGGTILCFVGLKDGSLTTGTLAGVGG